MLTYEQIMYIGSIAMLLPCVFSVTVFKTKDSAAKIIAILMFATFFSEKLGNYFAYTHRNSNAVYGIYSAIEIFLIGLFFNNSVDTLKKKKIGIIIGGIGFCWGLVDFYFVQSPTKLNAFFLMSESVIIVGLCLYAFYRMLVADDNLNLLRHPNFWFTAIFLFFWTSSFFIWGLYDFMTGKLHVNANLINIVLLTVNVIAYLSFALVFLFYNKMQKSK